MAEYIEREVLLQKLSRMIDYCKKDQKVTGLTALFQVGDAVKDFAAADVAPVVHGRWESVKNPKYPAYSHDKCSICGWWNTRNALCYEEGRRGGHSLNYCPNCGGKMDLEDENG